MSSDSLFKDAVRSLSNTFFKVIGFTIGVVAVLVGIGIMVSGTPQRVTTTIMLPDHNWKVKPYSSTTPTLLFIPITGVVGLDIGVRSEKIAAMLQDIQELELKPGMFKGIILYINSPGGSADDSDSIYRMLTEFKKQFRIPVYAYIDGLCASGGTLISLAADKIIASPASMIGHVGAIMGTHFNVSKPLTQFGVESKTIFAGKHKDELNPFRPWQPGEGSDFQNLVDVYYTRFIKLVISNRPRMTEEQLREEGAKIYPPEQALEQGYIDEISETYMKTLNEIASTLEISSNYQVIQLRPQIFLTEIFGNEARLSLPHAFQHFLRLPGDTPPELVGKPLYLYVPEAK